MTLTLYIYISITLQGSSFSMCSHKPVLIYRDKRKSCFFSLIQPHNICFILIIRFERPKHIIMHVVLKNHLLNILKRTLQNFSEVLQKCFLGTICIVIPLAHSNIRSQSRVLSVVKGLMIMSYSLISIICFKLLQELIIKKHSVLEAY